MKNPVKKVLALVSVGILALGLAGCGSSQGNDKKAAQSGEKKAIVVATRGTAKPFSYTDDKGNLTGYDVEILKEIEKRDPSLHFEFKPMSPDAAFVAMKSKQVDMIANQMRRNPTREKKYIYTTESNNYTARKLVVKEGRTDIQSFDDLNGKKVAITSNSEFNDLVKAFNKEHKPGIDPIYSDKGAAENLNLVATGRADAAGEYEYVVNVARKEQGLPVQAVGSVMQSVPTFFLLRKDPQMQAVADKIDKILKQMKEDGTLKKLSIQYLGKDYTVQPQ
ncbi:transporter substrate-binding domain-containing protein [Acidaminococcus timonensis]|uniref:transporter substrate-binding domain-containing protein n=1 Tax=Acidaminococcus timonensis TaxID=1871002 RepID=UPI0026F01756|nr:transporter substrate-binding domain-containing protein [Acidaminococcus timonensis]